MQHHAVYQALVNGQSARAEALMKEHAHATLVYSDSFDKGEAKTVLPKVNPDNSTSLLLDISLDILASSCWSSVLATELTSISLAINSSEADSRNAVPVVLALLSVALIYGYEK